MSNFRNDCNTLKDGQKTVLCQSGCTKNKSRYQPLRKCYILRSRGWTYKMSTVRKKNDTKPIVEVIFSVRRNKGTSKSDTKPKEWFITRSKRINVLKLGV